jgi:hypothetical protein
MVRGFASRNICLVGRSQLGLALRRRLAFIRLVLTCRSGRYLAQLLAHQPVLLLITHPYYTRPSAQQAVTPALHEQVGCHARRHPPLLQDTQLLFSHQFALPMEECVTI